MPGTRSLRTGGLAAVVALVGLSLAAPALGAQPAPTTPAQVDAWSAVPVTQANIDAAVASLDGVITAAMAATGVPGVAAGVVHNGQLVYAKGFGVRDVGTGEPVDADTAFQIASMSKPISASVVAAVVGSSKLRWDDPVTKYLKYFKLSQPYPTKRATIGDAFAMATGLPHQAGDDLGELGFTRKQILTRLRLLPLEPFRGQHLYANYSLTAGAEAVARAAGTKWEDLAARRVFAPLGMTRTTFKRSEFVAMPNHATLHIPAAGASWVANGIRDESAQAPAGMVSSTVRDLGNWMSMMLGGGTFQGRAVVDQSALAQMFIPRMPTGQPASMEARTNQYGYGIGVRVDGTGRVRYTHSGAFSQGAATTVALLPQANLGITVLSNGYPVGAVEAIAADFLDRVELGTSSTDWLKYWNDLMTSALAASGITSDPGEPRPAGARPARRLSTYVGTYDNPYYGPVRVTRGGQGTLVATVGPARLKLELAPFDRDTFATVVGDGRYLPAAQFKVRNGRAVSVQFAALAAPGQEKFRR